MTTVIVVCEGRTEVAFVKELLQPRLAHAGIYMEPRLISTSSQARGGALDGQRVRRYLRNTLRERRDTCVTTFFDLYGLPANFPGRSDAPSPGDPLDRARHIETELHRQVVHDAGCRPERFVPHVQPHEFEALLFSDVTAFEKAEPSWRTWTAKLAEARMQAGSPEHINDGPDTHPSARLRQLSPEYKKVAHGVAVSSCIGLHRIRAECRHFDRWLTCIEGLPALASMA